LKSSLQETYFLYDSSIVSALHLPAQKLFKETPMKEKDQPETAPVCLPCEDTVCLVDVSDKEKT
jgi:hypothetical protein